LPDRDIRTPPPRSVITAPPPVVPTTPTGPTVTAENTFTPPGPVIGTNPGPSVNTELVTVPPRAPPRNPVRVDALFDPRFGGQQPPYPSSEERAEREGQVRIRVTIGADGRVIATQRLAATNDAFWRATEAQARNRWRFRPATLDGRPVQASKVITIHFRLDGR
jgi:protein TonB